MIHTSYIPFKEFSYLLGIDDIDQSTDGISAIEGMLKFNSDLIESVDINTSNNWSVDINKNEGDSLKGKFVIARLGAVKESQVIARLHAKIRENATVKTGTITLQDVFSSYKDGATDKTTKTITINIAEEGGKKEEDPIITPDKPDTPSTPASQDKSSTPTTPAQTSSKSTGRTSTTTSKATTLPKAGIIASGIGMAILAAIIVAIIELVKYKKIGK